MACCSFPESHYLDSGLLHLEVFHIIVCQTRILSISLFFSSYMGHKSRRITYHCCISSQNKRTTGIKVLKWEQCKMIAPQICRGPLVVQPPQACENTGGGNILISPPYKSHYPSSTFLLQPRWSSYYTPPQGFLSVCVSVYFSWALSAVCVCVCVCVCVPYWDL